MRGYDNPTANALLYFRIESVHRITRDRYPFEISRAKNKKWKSPASVVIPLDALEFVTYQHVEDILSTIATNYSAVYQHDFSENFEYELIAEKIVWQSSEGKIETHTFNQP